MFWRVCTSVIHSGEKGGLIGGSRMIVVGREAGTGAQSKSAVDKLTAVNTRGESQDHVFRKVF
jgi:hypothetical protein